MVEQDGWEPRETQPKPLLSKLLRLGPHYEGMQESMGPFGTAGPRRKVETTVAPL